MILTGKQIKWAKENGYLDISDWDDSRLNPNSYNLRLADEIAVYGTTVHYKEPICNDRGCISDFREYDKEARVQTLDMARAGDLLIKKIPEEGYILKPHVLYLARTMEYTKTDKFVPMLEGRSSVGRLGISIHSTAGFGDIGFHGYWTLEISCVQPVRIYPGVEICQIYYHTICDNDTLKDMCLDTSDIPKYDSGKYQKNSGIQPSMMWKEFST